MYRRILLERDRRLSHVVVVLHEEHGAGAPGVGDAIAIGRTAERATRHFALVLLP